jgi:hypothetical protein
MFYARNTFKFHSIESMFQFTSQTQQSQHQAVEHVHIGIASFGSRSPWGFIPYSISRIEQELLKDAELASIFSSLRSVTLLSLPRSSSYSLGSPRVSISKKELEQILCAGGGERLDIKFSAVKEM